MTGYDMDKIPAYPKPAGPREAAEIAYNIPRSAMSKMEFRSYLESAGPPICPHCEKHWAHVEESIDSMEVPLVGGWKQAYKTGIKHMTLICAGGCEWSIDKITQQSNAYTGNPVIRAYGLKPLNLPWSGKWNRNPFDNPFDGSWQAQPDQVFTKPDDYYGD